MTRILTRRLVPVASGVKLAAVSPRPCRSDWQVSGMARAKKSGAAAAIAASVMKPASKPAALTTKPARRLLRPAPSPVAVASALASG